MKKSRTMPVAAKDMINILLGALPQGRRIDVVEQIKAAVDTVVFPKGALGAAVTGMGTQFLSIRDHQRSAPLPYCSACPRPSSLDWEHDTANANVKGPLGLVCCLRSAAPPFLEISVIFGALADSPMPRQ